MYFLRLKVGILLVIVIIVSTCIDPYTPNLKGYDSLLSVDALITDLNTPCTVRLTRTMQNQNEILAGKTGPFIAERASAPFSFHNGGCSDDTPAEVELYPSK